MICVPDKSTREVKVIVSQFTGRDLSQIFQDIHYSILLIQGFTASRSCIVFLLLNSSLFNCSQEKPTCELDGMNTALDALYIFYFPYFLLHFVIAL